jgi:hypothetical protein
MGPAPDEPALLVIQMGELDLKGALPCLRPLPEDLEDQSGAIDDLRLEGLL